MNIIKFFDGWIKTEDVPTYHGWPTMIRTADGELLVVCSGGRRSHICPYGRVFLYRSKDDGKTWNHPEHLSSGPLDDRDAGIIVAADGSLLVNYFTSVAFAEHDTYLSFETKKSAENWKHIEDNISLSDLIREHGFFMIRGSADGKTWSEKFITPVNNVHGPTLLSDGSLLWVGKELSPFYCKASRAGTNTVAARSVDNGEHWDIISKLPVPEGQDVSCFEEAYAIQAADGTIIAQVRNHNTGATGGEVFTWQCESCDGGLTWTELHPVTYGFPTHLLKLADGRLLMTYSYRKEPFGIRGRFSRDNGKNWSEEVILSDDAECIDFGYPSSVEMPDGSFITLWYESRNKLAQLRYMRWESSL